MQGSNSCKVPHDLSLVNVTLSGRRHFSESCRENEDWCTHCLDPELLDKENDTYYTVIEHHQIFFDSSYDAWQAKCLWNDDVNVFYVLEGVTLIIEDSIISDMRYKMTSFVWLENAFLRLIGSQVLRMDPSFAFIGSDDSPNSSILIQDCNVTGLNRDHTYHPEAGTDGRFVYIYGGATFTIINSTFTDLILQSPYEYDIIMHVQVLLFQVTNTIFARCIGNLFVLYSETGSANNALTNVFFERNFATYLMLDVFTYTTLELVGCRFIDNQGQRPILYGILSAILSGVFRNNRLLGKEYHALLSVSSPMNVPLRFENTVFEGNTAMDSSFRSYWSDYYLAHGLLTDNDLSAEKAAFQAASSCDIMLEIPSSRGLQIINTTIEDDGPSCNLILTIQSAFFNSTDLQVGLNNVWISTLSGTAIMMECIISSCSAQIQNSVLERAPLQLCATGFHDFFHLTVLNVTFQYATESSELAVVVLDATIATFLNCRWRHNEGVNAGGLSSKSGSVEIVASQFLNNSCWSGAGDINFDAGYRSNATLRILSCNFTASHSVLNTATIRIEGAISFSSVSDCFFSKSLTASGSIVRVAHNSGSLLLHALTFLDINAPSALLILISGLDTGASPTTIIEDLQVTNCSFYRAIATILGAPRVLSHNCNFTDNSGALLWIQSGLFRDDGSAFVTNRGFSLCFFGSETVSNLNHSLFRGNYQNGTTGLLYVEGPHAELSLQDCEFTDNVAKEADGLIQLLMESSLVLDSCLLSGNRALGSLISAQDSTLLLLNCSISNSLNLFQLEDAIAEVQSTTFNSIQTSAGAFALIRSTLALWNVSLSHVRGYSFISSISGSVSLNTVQIEELTCSKDAIKMVNSFLSLQRVNLTIISCDLPYAIINSAQGSVNMRDVRWTQCFSQVLSAQFSSVNLSYCVFANIRSQQKATLTCFDCVELSAEHTVWEQLDAKSVGVIWAQAVQVTIRHSRFINISASDTGAVQVLANSFLLLNTSFFNATAKGPVASGGALRLRGGSLNISRSSFVSCSAWTGGAVQWISGSLTESDNYFGNNTAALYGPDWASFPNTLRGNTSVLYVQLQKQLVVHLVDHFGQIVLTDNSSRAVLTTNHSSFSLGGILQTVAFKGQFTFSEFNALAKPGSTFTVIVTASSLSLEVTVVQRLCELGEIYTNTSCVRCLSGTYSLLLNSSACSQCPEGAECRDGSKLFPKPGYWRHHLDFPGVLRCPWPEACEGHNNYTSQTGVCAYLYAGHMCQSCKKGACRNGRDRCVACPGDTVLNFQAGFVCVGLPVLWGLQAFASLRGSGRRGPLLRMLIDYLQLTALIADYELSWPQPLQHFYSLHRYLGNAIQSFLPVDCLYSDAFYITTVAAALAPVVIATFFAICFGVMWLVFKAIGFSMVTSRDLFVNVATTSLAYIHPFLVRTVLSAFVCQTMEPGEQWLRSDMAVICWDKQHLTFVLTASLPALLSWGVGLPALASLYLIRRHHQSLEKSSLAGFLWGGFKEHYCLWEVGIGFCKAAMAALFTVPMFPIHQALTLVGIASLALLSQRIYHPYQDAVCNRVALLSELVVWLTAYAGVVFSSAGSNLLLQVLVPCLHAWFLLSWILANCVTRHIPFLWLLCLNGPRKAIKLPSN